MMAASYQDQLRSPHMRSLFSKMSHVSQHRQLYRPTYISAVVLQQQLQLTTGT